MSSLRDQLLKTGLVSEDDAQKATSRARKQAHKVKKDKRLAAEDAQRREAEAQRREAERQRKREAERQRSQGADARRRHRETLARARQLIESNRVNDPQAEIHYHFVVGARYLRSVRVTAQQQRLLAMGRLGIVSHEDDAYGYHLLPREAVLRLEAFYPRGLALLHPLSDRVEDEGDEVA